MAAKNPADVAAKWAQNLSNSTTSITAGVNAVQTAPGQLAAAKVATWISKLQQAQDKWVRNVSAVSLQDWKTAMLNKGIPRISSGAQAAQPKMQAFMQQWLPYVENIASTVRAMPNATLQDGIARAVAQIQGNAQFTYQK